MVWLCDGTTIGDVKPGCELSNVQIVQTLTTEKTLYLNCVKFTGLVHHYSLALSVIGTRDTLRTRDSSALRHLGTVQMGP